MRALISVYDKTGVEAFASALVALGFEIVASGGTAKALEAAGIPHAEVSDVTGTAEMLDGRVKTLHPAIHAGILADRAVPDHLAQLETSGIEPISVVACNLYPFTARPSIEMIDIGGPAMIRAAAKNNASVVVAVDPADYGVVLDELRREGEVAEGTRTRLARKAFAHTSAYDAAIVAWLDDGAGAEPSGEERPLPPTVHLALERCEELRYGENPHQRGARYRRIGAPGGWWEALEQHGGRELSYLNLFDADAAWSLADELADLGEGGSGRTAVAVIVKHANPCGAAVRPDISAAYEAAVAADPVSAFGGIVALTEPVDLALAEQLLAGPLADVLIAPAYDSAAVELLSSRRKNTRILSGPPPSWPALAVRELAGGFLVQDADRRLAGPEAWRSVTKAVPDAGQWRDLELAWRVAARTSSNAIVLAGGGAVLGVGCGQQSRVDAAKLAVEKAAGRAAGGAAASDAFFPFRDGLDAVVAGGVAAVVQPGGSLRDDEVIAAADEHGIAMVMTGERHFRH